MISCFEFVLFQVPKSGPLGRLWGTHSWYINKRSKT
jgi:hypothetical protein